MKTEQLDLVITITERFKETNIQAANADLAINALIHGAYDGFINKDEKELLRNTLLALDNIKKRTDSRASMKFCQEQPQLIS